MLALAHEKRSSIRSVLSCLEPENSLLDGLTRPSKPLKAIVLMLPGWKLSLFNMLYVEYFFLLKYGKPPAELYHKNSMGSKISLALLTGFSWANFKVHLAFINLETLY